jgi:hypothetical protein
MSKSAEAKVDDLLARESHLLREQKIHNIRAAMEALVYGAEKMSTTKCRQFQVLLTRDQQVATTWSDADGQKVMKRLELKIHPVTSSKPKVFDKLL